MGKLIVTGSGGTITINGGMVMVTGGPDGGAGIGHGLNGGDNGTLTITDSLTVEAGSDAGTALEVETTDFASNHPQR